MNNTGSKKSGSAPFEYIYKIGDSIFKFFTFCLIEGTSSDFILICVNNLSKVFRSFLFSYISIILLTTSS